MSIIDGVEVAAPPVQDRSRAPFTRWAFLWIWLGFTAVVLLEARGLIVRDTELGVDVAPLQWIASAVHLWDPSAFSGSVQIEKFGYLLPMAPFFALGQLLHVPVWITERIWLSSLLAIGAWGVIRLSEQLGQSRRWPRVLGAVVYCTAPIVIDWSSLSVDLLAVAFLPWVLLPLIKGSKDGSPRRMAARSGVAVALMGGVNATVILAAADATSRRCRPSPPGAHGVVGHLPRLGLLLVVRRRRAPGEIRLQLPSLHRDGRQHDEHRLVVRVIARNLGLAQLLPAGRWRRPNRWLSSRLLADCRAGHCHRCRARTGGTLSEASS